MRAVVVGGGVAGSACAVALARIGVQVTVNEAYADPAGPVGSFVSLSVNGLRALDALGCLPAVQRAGFAVDRQRMWSGRDRLLGDVPRGRRAGDPLRSVTVMRADLVGVLREEAARRGARFVLGSRLASPSGIGPGRDAESSTGLRIGTGNGPGPEPGTGPGTGTGTGTGADCGGPDLVVGADGIWSATRRALDPAAPE
ncbi:NAD(P)-binding protein, partial [Nonomuraea sp. NN258]|uniref:FAD-dependent oxidoreductase n=1 Tax=Nonomuraea antri TaxID=2730852 RepID=UPI0015682264